MFGYYSVYPVGELDAYLRLCCWWFLVISSWQAWRGIWIAAR